MFISYIHYAIQTSFLFYRHLNIIHKYSNLVVRNKYFVISYLEIRLLILIVKIDFIFVDFICRFVQSWFKENFQNHIFG